ncbi:MAG: trehalase family glycosidase [Candidatus Nanoperiomorbaceae bacterium]
MRFTKLNTDSVKASLLSVAAPALKVQTLLQHDSDFDLKLGSLLQDVQKQHVYHDGKTFVDLVPSRSLTSIRAEYNAVKDRADFNLREFVHNNFNDNSQDAQRRDYEIHPEYTALQQIDTLWHAFERRHRTTSGTLERLPYPYVVPGGRFSEQFYWDSYFIMLGLASAGRWNMVEGMIRNLVFQLRQYGYIPTANRTYLLSRSQPPFFSHMVDLLAKKKGRNKVLRSYLSSLTTEYRFWMRGYSKTKGRGIEYPAFRRVVRMPDGALLNRYYDNKTTPRPESLREDADVAAVSKRKDTPNMYLNLRAAAESGWDFSSRWLLDEHDLKTIHTTDIIPIDLNCLLYHLEITIADAYHASFSPIMARRFRQKARARWRAINEYCWDKEEGFYKDFNFHLGLPSPVRSLAAVFPLYVGIASDEQAKRVVAVLKRDFLKSGGLIATQINGGQQWDAPNGWAPLQWVAIQGLRRYGFDDLANEITRRWLDLNEKTYGCTAKLFEKYNVADNDGKSDHGVNQRASGIGGGGEYAPQDGFGWTNGVYEALKRQYDPEA